MSARGEFPAPQLDGKHLESFHTGTEQCSYCPSLEEENAQSLCRLHSEALLITGSGLLSYFASVFNFPLPL